jgi:transcriptional regulator with XRE-family HTH domain
LIGTQVPTDASRLRALGQRVRKLRKERELSQEKLAELSGVHENHIRRIEGGTANPSYLVFLRIAEALKIGPEELFR